MMTAVPVSTHFDFFDFDFFDLGSAVFNVARKRYVGPRIVVTYTGASDSEGLPHGHGKAEYANGDVYEGEWKAGKKHGEGTLTYADGAVYAGSFIDGQRHGRGTYAADGKLEGMSE